MIFLLAIFSLFGGASDLDVAREALRDGLWEVARNHASKDESDDAKLIVLESYACENRWDDVKRVLEETNSSGSGFDYYRAVTRGDVDGAIAALEKGGSQAGLVEAKMMKAGLLLKKGDRAAAEGLWQEVIAMTNAGERAFSVAAVNLGDVAALRKAYGSVKSEELRYLTGLQLGRELMGDATTKKEGERLIRRIVQENPGVEGAVEAFLDLARTKMRDGEWEAAEKLYSDAWEMWPAVAKTAIAMEGRGEVAMAMGHAEQALEFFRSAERASGDDALTALAILKEGDALSAMGKGEESLARYRLVLDKYSGTDVARKLENVIKIREMEAKGRELYRAYDFEGARKVFSEVAKTDPSTGARMAYFEVLCLYGLGMDDEAEKKAIALARECSDAKISGEVALWLAKFAYNRSEWKIASGRFAQFAAGNPDDAVAPVALLWSARAAFADADFAAAVKAATDIAERYPGSEVLNSALLVQGEALIELARFDEAVLVLDRVGKTENAASAERFKAKVLKADALFAMGADNSARYEAALEEYRKIDFDGAVDCNLALSVAFKIGRTLEKLKRYDESVDQYYSQVVLAYRNGLERGERFGDDAKAVFSRAAFRLVDEFERRGRTRQALSILQLVSASDVPAAEEAARRYERISEKGRFL